LPASYIPKGYIPTQQAVAQLIEARHADLVSSAPEREQEVRRLYALKAASKPRPIIPIHDHTPDSSDRVRPEFTPAQERRLRELGAIDAEMLAAREAAARDVRSALAEGDISAILLIDNGDETPISISRWRAKDGFTAVQTGRIDVRLPFGISTTKGRVLIKEIDFIVWLSINAPKPFSQVSVSVIAQNPAPRNQVAKPPVSTPSLEQPAKTNGSTTAEQPEAAAVAVAKR